MMARDGRRSERAGGRGAAADRVGHSNKAIAAVLRVGVKSVETYKARAMDKLGFHSRVELVGYALGHGWLAEG